MKRIERNFDGNPIIVKDIIENGDIIENTLAPGFGSIVIDEKFIQDMYLIADKIKDINSLVSLLTELYYEVNDYYYSKEASSNPRERTYHENQVTDEDGMFIGTKISSLKGKNLAKCSEKSIAAYIVLEKLYSMEILKRKPSLILSQMQINDSKQGPHAFIMLDKERAKGFTKHILFDIHNPTLIEDKDQKKKYFVGLYSLNDEQYSDLINGGECKPISIYEVFGDYKDVGNIRKYGNMKTKKTK